MARKSGVSIQTTIYNQFRGADFSTDPSLVEKYRSPLCTNIMADEGGMPEKRPGWSVEATAEAGRINGIHRGVFSGTEKLLVHAKDKLYLWSGDTLTELLTGVNNEKSRSVFLVGKLWILTGAELVSYDGTTCQRVSSGSCYIPTVLIARMPTGGGDTYEQVNMLTPWRYEEFQADGEAVAYTVSSDIDNDTTVTVWVYDEETADWQQKTATTDYTVSGRVITFVTAPPAPSAGERDMVRVLYSHTVSGYADQINKCRVCATYGINGTNRISISGNPDYPNRDWTCAINDPTYWPDMGFGIMGSERNPIMGYLRIGEYLAIVKSNDGTESTVYFRKGTLSESGDVTYSTEPALSGVGAVAMGGFGELLDDPLFVSRNGVQAVSITNVNGSRVTQNRSYFVNPKLRQENLADAEAIVWNGMYLVCCASHVYVLDGRQEKSYRSAANSDYLYEAYYWENIPARVWAVTEVDGQEILWFGTDEGKLCRINSDDVTVNRFSDDGEPISAVWATKYDDDGTPSYLKTLLKAGCCVTIKPYTRSSGTVYFRTDRTEGTEQPVAAANMDIADFADIDFERFTFNTDASPQEIFFRKKLKNYRRLQIVIRNETLNEGFGVYQITKHYVVGNFAKRSSVSNVHTPDEYGATLEETQDATERAFEEVFEDG